jgi:hypothetical protein
MVGYVRGRRKKSKLTADDGVSDNDFYNARFAAAKSPFHMRYQDTVSGRKIKTGNIDQPQSTPSNGENTIEPKLGVLCDLCG